MAGDRERVTFTRGAADRIANAVRQVEIGERDGGALKFEPQVASTPPRVFRICTFTGAWSINTPKVVTFKNQTATPNTVSVTNLFWPIPSGPQRDCAIAKDGTAWYLLVPQLYATDAATAAELTTASLDFYTLPVVALATASTASFSIPIYGCSTVTITE